MKKYLIFLIWFIFVASVVWAGEKEFPVEELLADPEKSLDIEQTISPNALCRCYDLTAWSQTDPQPFPQFWTWLCDNDTFYGGLWGSSAVGIWGIWGTLKPAYTDYIFSLEFDTGCDPWMVSTFDFQWDNPWYWYTIYQGYYNCRDGSSGAARFWALEPTSGCPLI